MRHLLTPAVWGLLAGLTGLAGDIPYLRDAWRRASDPDPAAWLIWTVEYSVLLAVQAAQHPPRAALCLAALQLAGTAAVLGVLAARGGWQFGPGRWALLGGTVAVMGAWPFAHAPGLAMCLVLGVEGTAMILVMIGAYRHPHSETPLTWQAFVLAGLLDLPALGGHAPRLLYAYPAFFVIMGSGVLIAAALGDRAARVLVPRPRYRAQDRDAPCAPPPAGLPGRPVGGAPRRGAGAARPRTVPGGAAPQPAAGAAVPGPAAARAGTAGTRPGPGAGGDRARSRAAGGAGQPAAGAPVPRPAAGAAAPHPPPRPTGRQPA